MRRTRSAGRSGAAEACHIVLPPFFCSRARFHRHTPTLSHDMHSTLTDMVLVDSRGISCPLDRHGQTWPSSPHRQANVPQNNKSLPPHLGSERPTLCRDWVERGMYIPSRSVLRSQACLSRPQPPLFPVAMPVASAGSGASGQCWHDERKWLKIPARASSRPRGKAARRGCDETG